MARRPSPQLRVENRRTTQAFLVCSKFAMLGDCGGFHGAAGTRIMGTEERQAPMPMHYDQQQQTRVYQRERKAQHAETQHDERIGFTQPLSRPKGVMDGLSVAQVVAGAAAAATSMLLASKIGIAGSVIGAAVSSAVTIICSQLYRRALDASAEKLKQKQAKNSYPGAAPYATAALETRGVSSRMGTGNARTSRNGARIAPTKLQARAAAARSATQKKVIAVSIALAIAAVAATAGIILFATAGEGLGDKTVPLLASTNSDTDSASGRQSGQGAQNADGQGAGASNSNADTGMDSGQSSNGGASNSGTSGADSSQNANSSSNGTGSGASNSDGAGGDSSQNGTDSSTDTSGNGSSTDGSGDSGSDTSNSDSGTSSSGTTNGTQNGAGQDSASAHATMES